MNTIINEMLKKQYRRLTDGHVKVIRGVEYLISKGFDTVRFDSYIAYMKNHGIEI